MGFVALKCPSCGSTVEVDDSREFGFCSYCGTKIVQDKIVVEHRGSISVSGVANEQSLLERAFLFIEDGRFDMANQYLEKVLDLNPRCSKAYIGKLLCELRLNSISELNKLIQPLEKYDNYLKAKRFASPTELESYQAIENAISNNLKAKQKALQDAIASADLRLEAFGKKIEAEKAVRKKNQWKRILWIILIIVLGFVALICSIAILDVLLGQETIFSLAVALFVFLLVPSIVGIVFLVRQKTKAENAMQDYDKMCRDYASARRQVAALKNDYEEWVRRTF